MKGLILIVIVIVIVMVAMGVVEVVMMGVKVKVMMKMKMIQMILWRQVMLELLSQASTRRCSCACESRKLNCGRSCTTAAISLPRLLHFDDVALL